MDSHALLVRTVATLARRQIALEALLQGKGISKEDIAEAAGQVPIPQTNPTYSPLRQVPGAEVRALVPPQRRPRRPPVAATPARCGRGAIN
jgi:hypothetical protein